MKSAILFVNLNRNNAEELSKEIKKELERRNFRIKLFTFASEQKFNPEDNYDLAFSLGGDGTVLYAARAMAFSGAPVFPVNLGTLGFIAAIHPDNWLNVFESWLDNNITISKRLMLEARVESGGSNVKKMHCLNDFVISSSGKKMLRLNVFTGSGEKAVSIGQYRADGLITATPTGSTAYSAAAGGPILDPEMEAIILNPICPFTISARPLILPADETITIEVERIQRCGVILTVDGQETLTLEPGDRIVVTASSRPCSLIASDRSIFYNALKTKLSWLGVNNA